MYLFFNLFLKIEVWSYSIYSYKNICCISCNILYRVVRTSSVSSVQSLSHVRLFATP